jgi:hypothetical protein
VRIVGISAFHELRFTEYLLRLRQAIQTSPRSSTVYSITEHLNGAVYWKDLFQQSQFEIHELQIKISALTKESIDQASDSPTQKRKAHVEPTLSRRATKRLTNPIKVDPQLASTAVLEVSEIATTGKCDMILYHLFAIQKVLEMPTLDENCVAAHLIQVTHELGKHLNSICKDILLQPPSRLEMAEAREISEEMSVFADLRAFERAFGLVLYYVTQLPRSQQNTKSFGTVVYKCVGVFNQILENITAICRKVMLPDAFASRRTDLLSPRVRDRCLSLLTKVFLDLIRFWNASSPLHFQLFEGVAFVVIERCGTLLYTLTFGHERTSNLEAEIEADQKALNSDDEAQNETVKNASTEAKYLFMLLKRIMAIAPKFCGARSSDGNGISKATPTTSIRLAMARLPLDAKRRLQETLIQCIWNEKKDYSDITDCLSKPVLHAPLPTLPKGHAATLENQSWFILEMWKLIGWDVLGRHNSLNIA